MKKLLAIHALLALLATARAEIILSPKATQLETYAAQEFQRYYYQLTDTLLPIATNGTLSPTARDPLVLIGTPATLPLIAELAPPAHTPGPQGYTLKTTTHQNRPALIISGADPEGVLHGVYGMLDEHYGIGFHFDGDVLPPQKFPAQFPAVDETKTPAQSLRGFLPWSNFPQSPSSFTWEDWVFVLDQAAKMRFNMIHLHNYSGDFGHNEMFHSFWTGGKTKRVWFASGRSGYGGTKGFDIKRWVGRSAELVDDYDTGSDTGLHNEGLSDAQVFRKGVTAFQRILDHAHKRGIKIALGIDITDTVNQYPAPDTDPELVRNRSVQLATDYPELDYVIFFVSERIKQKPALWPRWKTIFDSMYSYLKEHSPKLRYGVSGWGDAPTAAQAATLPPDIVCAQIAGYSAGFVPGDKYGDREYWGCPWLECDINSSQWYYPYRMHLTDTIAAYQARSKNMTGLYCLTWRLTDAISPKIWYIARAPWDTKNELKDARTVYHQFAKRWYGAKAADAITAIINENEPDVGAQSECGETLPFATSVEKDAPPLLVLHSFSFTSQKGGTPFAPAIDARTKDSGVKTVSINGKPAVTEIDSGDWIAFPLPSDKRDETLWDTFTATVTPGKNGGKIEVRYRFPDGEKISEILVPPAGENPAPLTLSGRLPPRPLIKLKYDIALRFTTAHGDTQLAKACAQLKTIAAAIRAADSPEQQYRLALLRSRIAAARDHLEINNEFPSHTKWPLLPDLLDSWMDNFSNRVTDATSLGNIASIQIRSIQKNYLPRREQLLLTATNGAPPRSVTAYGTPGGARVTWETERPAMRGYNIYRGSTKITPTPLSATAREFTDTFDGGTTYTVKAVAESNRESTGTRSAKIPAGAADKLPPQIILVSPPTSAPENQPIGIKARLLDTRDPRHLSAQLHYRRAGEKNWTSLPMLRRAKAVFTATLPAQQAAADNARQAAAFLEYYITASDGTNTAIFPAEAPARPLALTLTPNANPFTLAEPVLVAQNKRLEWQPVAGAHTYRLYRSTDKNFAPSNNTFLTYIGTGDATAAGGPKGEELHFADLAQDFNSDDLRGAYYYRLTAVTLANQESPASPPVSLAYP